MMRIKVIFCRVYVGPRRLLAIISVFFRQWDSKLHCSRCDSTGTGLADRKCGGSPVTCRNRDRAIARWWVSGIDLKDERASLVRGLVWQIALS